LGLYASLFALLTVQGFRHAYAGITVPNPDSERFHAEQGFTPVGVYRGVGYKLGAWRDVGWLERALAPETPDPAPPTPLPAILGTSPFRAALDAGLPYLRK
jgi:phosphinothricin acetyltransferase